MNSPFPSSGLPKTSLCVKPKRVLVQNFSCENEFDLHENELVGETHFHIKNGFALRLVLTQRQTRTRKWAILKRESSRFNIAYTTYFPS